VFKNDNSDSSQSDEDNDDNSPLGFMAEGELAAEDPQVLKYVRLEQKRRKYKDSAPKTSSAGSLASLFSKRQGKDDTGNYNENNSTSVTNDENALLSSNSTDSATMTKTATGFRSNNKRRRTEYKLRRVSQPPSIIHIVHS